MSHHDVIIMPVSNAQNISNHAVPSTGPRKRVGLGLEVGAGVVPSKIVDSSFKLEGGLVVSLKPGVQDTLEGRSD